MIQIKKTNIEEIESLRIDYFESLPRFQDIFLEFVIKDSNYYKLQFSDKAIGYVIKSPDNILVELYFADRFIPYCSEYFDKILKELEITSIYCKSFDYLLLDLCLANKYSYKLIGCLYRDYYAKERFVSNDLTIRYADESDLPFLSQQDDEVFEPKELLDTFVKNKEIVIFQTNNQTIGCGFLTRVHQKFNYFDIGVWTHPEYRKKGNATQIILYLKETCLKNSWIPICGCDIDNIASQKTLEKTGFISKHKLIEFEINNNKNAT